LGSSAFCPTEWKKRAYLTLIIKVKVTVTSFLYATFCHTTYTYKIWRQCILRQKKFCPIPLIIYNFYLTMTIEVKVIVTLFWYWHSATSWSIYPSNKIRLVKSTDNIPLIKISLFDLYLFLYVICPKVLSSCIRRGRRRRIWGKIRFSLQWRGDIIIIIITN
jgi:hypothetical protein